MIVLNSIVLDSLASMELFIFEKNSYLHEINLEIAFVIQAFNIKKSNGPSPLLQFGFKKKK